MGADNVRPVTEDTIRNASRILRAGGLVAFPTETVYGLGANARDREAVLSIFRTKGRPADNPLIVHVASLSAARSLSSRWPALAERLARRFWPGPLTIVVEAAEDIPAEVRGGLDTVAVRWPAHPVAEALIQAADVPVAAPSANRSGRPSPTTAEAVSIDLGDAVGVILDGGPCDIGVESTVVDVSGLRPVLLRPGGLAREAIEEVVGSLEAPAPGGPARSPGMKYRHYAPSVPVALVRGDASDVPPLIRARSDPASTGVLACTQVVAALPDYVTVDLGSTVEMAASRLFSGLRQLDASGVALIVAVWSKTDTGGLGLAVLNRLEKAASEVWG